MRIRARNYVETGDVNGQRRGLWKGECSVTVEATGSLAASDSQQMLLTSYSPILRHHFQYSAKSRFKFVRRSCNPWEDARLQHLVS